MSQEMPGHQRNGGGSGKENKNKPVAIDIAEVARKVHSDEAAAHLKLGNYEKGLHSYTLVS